MDWIIRVGVLEIFTDEIFRFGRMSSARKVRCYAVEDNIDCRVLLGR